MGMMGFTNQGVAAGVDASTWSALGIFADGGGGSPATASVTFGPNGAVSYSVSVFDGGTTVPLSAYWYGPSPSTGIGSSYWIRVTASGIGVTAGTVGSFISLGAGQTWSRNATVAAGTRTTTLTIDISSSATGTPIVASGSLVLEANA